MDDFIRFKSRVRPRLACKDPSLTRQEFLADSLISNIRARFVRDGVLPQPNLGRPPVAGDGLPFDELANEFTQENIKEFEDHEIGTGVDDSQSHIDGAGEVHEEGKSSPTGESETKD